MSKAQLHDLPTILVVDDSTHDYEMYVRYLNKARPNKYRMKFLSIGRQVFSAMDETPHCLLLDLSLPDMSGLEILKKLKDDNKGALPFPVVIVTGSGDDTTGQKAVSLGAQDYLIKEEVTEESLSRSIEFAATRFRLEQRLRASEARYRQLADHMRLASDAAALGYWSWDAVTGAVNPDEKNRKMLGLPLTGALTFTDFVRTLHEEDRPVLENAVWTSLRTGVNYDEEFRVRHADGSVHWISSRGSVTRDSEGKTVGMAGIAIDITERKKAQEELVAATAKFRAVFDQTSVFAGIMSLDGTLIDVNRVSLEACGFRADEVLGRPLWETGWWQGSQEVQGKIRDAAAQAANGIPYREILTYCWADGTERLVDFELHPIRDDSGRIIFLHPTGVDITELKQVEADLRKSREKLEQKVAERTQELAHSLAEVESEIAVRKKTEEELQELSARVLRLQDEEHRRIARELHDSTGQTLTAMKMTVAALGSLVKSIPGADQLVEDLNVLTDDALKDIRTTAHLLHPPLLDEVGLTSAARWYVDELAKRSGIKANLEISATPPLSKGAELAMFRVLQESLTNVIRHSGSPRVDVSLQSDGDNALLTVRDFGKGIPSGKLASFQKTGAGVGIGLGGMKQRLRELRGHLKVESDETGTCITAFLPVNKAQRSNSHSDRADVQGVPTA
jgi:PAS domain S-box-containing protein